MKKYILIILFILPTYILIKANTIDSLQARLVAMNFYSQNTKIKEINLTLAYTKVSSESRITIYYVYNVNQNDGWIIVAADDASFPILGYSLKGHFKEENLKSNFLSWMDNYEEQILYIKKNNIQPDQRIKNRWEYLQKKGLIKLNKVTSNVAPLLNTSWTQGRYYNNLCPPDLGADSNMGGHVPAGCVAIAMAQIMTKWKSPVRGTGVWQYSSNYGLLSANFGSTTYNWNYMPSSLDSKNDAVATLIYQCGVSVEMQYGTKESGAYVISATSPTLHCAEYALKTYFGYNSNTLHSEQKNNVTSDLAWVDTLEKELDNGRPILYSAADYSSTPVNAHAWVCDGYDSNDLMHMNWGLIGNPNPNGYYAVSALNPGTHKFNNDQAILIGIQPSPVCTDEFEPNDNSTSATHVFKYPLNNGNSDYTLTANIGWPGDQDWYKIDIGYSGILTINLTTLPFNCDLELYGPNGLNQFIKGSYNSGASPEQIAYPYSGSSTTVYAKVYAQNPADYSTESCYNLEFVWSPVGSTCIPVKIVTQPSDQTVGVNNSATFTVSVSGSSPFSYFWYKNQGNTPVHIDTNISSSTDSYTVNTVSATDNGSYYHCYVTNCHSLNRDTSRYALLTVQNQTCTYSLSKDSANFPYTGGSGSFTINTSSGCNWSISHNSTSGCGLINLRSSDNGTGTYTINYQIAQNVLNYIQTCTLTITGDNGFSKDFVVTEDANPTCNPQPNPHTAEFTAQGGQGSFHIDVGEGCSWNVYDHCSSMLTNINPNSGKGPTTITYTVLPNESSETRSCEIIVQANLLSHIITQLGLCNPPSSPSNIAASQTNILPGQSATLYVIGGVLNSASNWTWYCDSCSGVQIGTGDTLTVTPVRTTKYFVSASGCGVQTTCKSITITVDTLATQIEFLNENNIHDFSLYQNYPNPFNPTTIIKYQLPMFEKIKITVFDVLGREVETLIDDEKPKGSYSIEFNASGLASGIYFYRMQTGSYVETKKLILLK